MVISDFIAYLQRLDVKLWVEGDRLRCNAPKGVLTSTLQAELASRKAEILVFLQTSGPGKPNTAPPLLPISRNGECLLSFPQQRLWVMDQLAPDTNAYNIQGAVRFTGVLDIAVLEHCLDEIIRRHEALRTTFAVTDGAPIQRVSPPEPFHLTVTDLQHLPETERERKADALIAAQAERPFDLERGPLFRACLFRLSPQEHFLFLAMHHIVSDGWSLGVLTRELEALYRALSSGQEAVLPELPVQYADFAHWQRQWLQGDVLKEQLAYWKQRLHNPLPALELPADHPRPPVQSFRGALLKEILPTSLAAALNGLSRQEGVTLFMTLLAAFKALLYRYTGQEDIIVGTPIANRNRIEIENLIGFFVNMLVLRTDVSGNPTFRELLQRIRDVTLDAYAHQDLPFELLVETLQPERDTSRSPLFQVLFVQAPPAEMAKLPGLTLTPIQVDNHTSKYDLSIYVHETPEGLTVAFEYSTDLFDTETIERMAAHYRVLLEGIIADPTQRLSALPLLTEMEQRQVTVEWNATAAEYPRELCVHQLVEAQAQRTPDAVAVEYEQERLSYAELERRAEQLARYLRSLGVQPGSLVGVCLERSAQMVVALLGVLKAGGAYVPLDPLFPPERLAYMLTDAQATVLLTQEHLAAELDGHGAQMVCLDTDWETIANTSTAIVPNTASPEDLAYVIYTSGSTGKPKGVQVLHRGVVNFLASMQREPGLRAQDVLLAVTTLSFDIAGLELFLPLISGARVVIAPREAAADASRLVRLLSECGATVLQATPVTWRMLVEAGWQGDGRLKALCGGEALPRDLANELLKRCGEVWNLYGPTETTIWSTLERVEEGRPMTIGRPIANTQVYILDGHMQPTPMGVAGELYIGGDGLARGYLRRPELTAERFVPDPFTTGARLYRTGDLARWRADGRLEYLGRADFQVKLRGYRIELGEIEAVLEQHPGVRQAVVMVREDMPGDRRLVAYIAPQAGETFSAGDLRAFLKGKLPEYMLPAAFVSLETFPLTPNRKVDRKALPAPDGARREAEVTYVPPQTQIEQLIAPIWQEVLRVERVGIHDNFFDLGGHSLLVVRVHDKLRQAGYIHLTVADMFKYPTISALSQYLSNGHEMQASFNSVQGALERARRQQEALRRNAAVKMADRKAE